MPVSIANLSSATNELMRRTEELLKDPRLGDPKQYFQEAELAQLVESAARIARDLNELESPVYGVLRRNITESLTNARRTITQEGQTVGVYESQQVLMDIWEPVSTLSKELKQK